MRGAGIGPGGNVYAELGSTWWNLIQRPDEAAHVLGKLLVALGPDNILWGTDSIWYGSPQGQIEAFRAFEITPEYQERFGYPALTADVKARILGLNAARVYGIDPATTACALSAAERDRPARRLARSHPHRSEHGCRRRGRRSPPTIHGFREVLDSVEQGAGVVVCALAVVGMSHMWALRGDGDPERVVIGHVHSFAAWTCRMAASSSSQSCSRAQRSSRCR